MSSKIAALRALALAHASKLHPQHVILDDSLRAELAAANQAIDTLETRIAEMRLAGNLPAAEPKAPESLADAPAAKPARAQIEQMLDNAREVATSVQQEALDSGVVMVLQFQRLAPAEYQVIVDKAEREARKAAKDDDQPGTESEHFLRIVREGLLQRCYVRAETPDGEDLGFTLDELCNTGERGGAILNHADRTNLGQFCIEINRSGQAVPFRPAPSGTPATN